jgi:hypothetical protein
VAAGRAPRPERPWTTAGAAPFPEPPVATCTTAAPLTASVSTISPAWTTAPLLTVSAAAGA